METLNIGCPLLRPLLRSLPDDLRHHRFGNHLRVVSGAYAL